MAKPFGGVASPRISPSPGPPSVPRQTVTQVAVWWEGADGGPWPLGAGAGGGPWRYLAAALLFPPLRCRATLTWWRGLASPRAFAVCWRARGGDQEPGDISILLHIEGRMIMMMKLVMLMMAMTKKMMLTGCR